MLSAVLPLPTQELLFLLLSSPMIALSWPFPASLLSVLSCLVTPATFWVIALALQVHATLLLLPLKLLARLNHIKRLR